MRTTLVLIACATALWLWALRPNTTDTPTPPPASAGEVADVADVADKGATAPMRLHFTTEEKGEYASKLVDDLNDPAGDIEGDLEMLDTVFRQFRSAYGDNPIGNHEQILAHLTGGNPNQVAYIPATHPAIRGGKLHDRWGTPFYFHQISSDVMEVRSAGPDGRHWNSDDTSTR